MHILRKRGSEFHRFPGHGMGEGQPVGVECLPADVRHIRIVQVVSNERIAQILHVDPDLVGAAGP